MFDHELDDRAKILYPCFRSDAKIFVCILSRCHQVPYRWLGTLYKDILMIFTLLSCVCVTYESLDRGSESAEFFVRPVGAG